MTEKELKFLDFILTSLNGIYPNHKSISDLDRLYSKSTGCNRQDYLKLKDFVNRYDYEYFEKVTPMYAIKITYEWNEKIENHGSLIRYLEFKKVIDIINESIDSSINQKYITERSNISPVRVNEIFNILIDNDVVHDLRSKRGSEINKKGFIDYDLSFLAERNTPVNININAAPSNNPDQKSRLKKFFSNPYVIGAIFFAMEEITFGKLWKFIYSWISNM